MGKFQIKGFPTIILFDTENKDEPLPYNGDRTAQAIADWLKTQNINEEKKELIELTKANYIQECNRNFVCLVFILDKKSDKSKLSWLKETIAEQSARPVKFLYSERLNTFESQLMIDDRSCPKLVSIWDSINSYRIYNGELNH